MEKQSKGREPKSSTGQKTLGTNAENYASFLIGSIVEKGISDDPLKKPAPIPLPKPTVLPFPIARHRSHGPHWGPIGSKSGDHENDDSESNDEDDEDKNFAQFGAMADFANPVHKKKKKGLDFSRWKEHVQGDNSSMAKKSDENMLHSSKTTRKVKGC
ncbi:Transcriptional elongation regulator MINIYO [Quillaja saponaria]|uniref:Transcriptional elongation regulator MINIYO n=1 Tax=Quillaja saponaria TaxID=32244 RepID=A0AAD7KWA9_QUISA|nr:Transcriptional elongation regulator MINIYO [Quillaja saponaria]